MDPHERSMFTHPRQSGGRSGIYGVTTIKTSKNFVLYSLLSALVSQPAAAVLIAYESFDYPASSNLSSNAGGTGFIGSWIYSPLISNHGTINPNLIYGKLDRKSVV